jgi:DNA-binding NarL/FixJ family response regulator
MFQEFDSRVQEAHRPVRPSDAGQIYVAEPASMLEALLRGGLEVISVRRVDCACVVAVRTLQRRRRGLSRKEREVFERLMRGSCQKEIAYDIGVALTTVSAHVRFSLHKLGLENWETAVLVVAALENGLVVNDVTSAGGERVVVLKVDLSAHDLARLTEAERTVALFALDGCTNAQIADLRRCSPRTVANQVASAFRKLGVRCRLELIRLLASVPKVSDVEIAVAK